jgi:hypothetical protein
VTNAALCAAYDAALHKATAEASRRIADAKGRYRDAWAAASYRRTHPWVKTPLAEPFHQWLHNTAVRGLNVLSDGQAGVIDDLDAYLADSLSACGLEEREDQVATNVAGADRLGEKIRTLANTKPWYPRGFHEYGSDLAIRWLDHAGADCYSRCWYWTLEVVSNEGCPAGLYGEISIEKGGVAVDWTNDSLSSLRPFQRGRLQFVTYSDSAYGASGSLSELSCY